MFFVNDSKSLFSLLHTRLKFPNKSVSGHYPPLVYFSNMDHFYYLSLNHLQVSFLFKCWFSEWNSVFFMRMIILSRRYYYSLVLVCLCGRGLGLKLHNIVSRASPPLICLALSKSLNNFFWKQFPWWQMGMVIPPMTTWQRWCKDAVRWNLRKCSVNS